jgi:hypothetical protein
MHCYVVATWKCVFVSVEGGIAINIKIVIFSIFMKFGGLSKSHISFG